MTPADIIDMATRRTGKRGYSSGQLNINLELLLVIQEFCKASKWKWRRSIAQFPLALNSNKYDLWTVFPDFQTMEAMAIVVDPATVPPLDEVLDPWEQDAIMEGSDPGQPTKYFVHDGHNLVVYPVPDTESSQYPLRLSYWAVPSAITDSNGNLLSTVPTVPYHLHDTLVKGLEKQILRYTVGAEDAKYQLTAAEYDAAVEAAGRM